MANQNENIYDSWNLSLLDPRAVFGDFPMRKQLITLLATTCLLGSVGCAKAGADSASASVSSTTEESVNTAEETKKEVILGIIDFAAHKYIGTLDNTKYTIKENDEIDGYELNLTVTGLHAALEANIEGLESTTKPVISACEKTSSTLSKLLAAAKLSDSNFQVNILDDTDSSIKLYSALNGETIIDEITN